MPRHGHSNETGTPTLNNNSTPVARLRGCLNDVKKMANFLEDEFDFTNIEILTDEVSDKLVCNLFLAIALFFYKRLFKKSIKNLL